MTKKVILLILFLLIPSLVFGAISSTKGNSNPVVSPEVDNSLSDLYGVRNSFLYTENGVYYVFYESCPVDWNAPERIRTQLQRAHTSDATLKTGWVKDGTVSGLGNPVPYEVSGFGSGPVIKSGSTYYMFLIYVPYAYLIGPPIVQSLATSSSIDGPWTLYNSGNSILPLGDWDSNYAIINSVIPAPVSSGYTWMAFYIGNKLSPYTNGIGVAYSNNLTSWTKYGSNPITTTINSTNSYENPYVFKWGTDYYMLLNQYSNGLYNVGSFIMKADNSTLLSWTYQATIVGASVSGWDSIETGMACPLVVGNHVYGIFDGGNVDSEDVIECHMNRKLGQFEITGLPDTNGVCGSAGSTFTDVPTENLCTVGENTTVVEDGGFFLWSCEGNGEGSTAPCQAQHKTQQRLLGATISGGSVGN